MLTALFKSPSKELLGLVETDDQGRFMRIISQPNGRITLTDMQATWQLGLLGRRATSDPDTQSRGTAVEAVYPNDLGFAEALRHWALDHELLPVEIPSDRRETLIQTLKLPLQTEELYAFFQALRDAEPADLAAWRELAPSLPA